MRSAVCVCESMPTASQSSFRVGFVLLSGKRLMIII